jgi:hypothetical protein
LITRRQAHLGRHGDLEQMDPTPKNEDANDHHRPGFDNAWRGPPDSVGHLGLVEQQHRTQIKREQT